MSSQTIYKSTTEQYTLKKNVKIGILNVIETIYFDRLIWCDELSYPLTIQVISSTSQHFNLSYRIYLQERADTHHNPVTVSYQNITC